MKLIDDDVGNVESQSPLPGEKRRWVDALQLRSWSKCTKVTHRGWSPIDLFTWEAVDGVWSHSLFFYRDQYIVYYLDTFIVHNESFAGMEPQSISFSSTDLGYPTVDEVLGFVEEW